MVLHPMRIRLTFDSKTYFKPHFKPDFNRELLRSNNYICHLLTVKKGLLMEAGLYKEEFDGAQDYDLILRCSEKAKQIRTHSAGTISLEKSYSIEPAANPGSKSYAYELVEKLWKRI